MRDLESTNVEAAAALADEGGRIARRLPRVRPWSGDPQTAPDGPDEPEDERVEYDDRDYCDAEREA